MDRYAYQQLDYLVAEVDVLNEKMNAILEALQVVFADEDEEDADVEETKKVTETKSTVEPVQTLNTEEDE